MAEVFLGKRLGDGVGAPLLAVKRVLPQFSNDPEIVAMFEDETRIAQRLSHPNICKVYDQGTADKQLYLAMEFIHGKDLRVVAQKARKSGERVPYTVSATIAAGIADALDYAHAMRGASGSIEPVIHRDVSPQNILVSYDGIPKLIDFGIAKTKNRVVETRVGLVKGKYGYMSPEQATGGQLDGRSDLFSLGCVLYELATGMEPFRSATDVSTLRKVARASHAPAIEVNTSMPKALADIIETSLALEPSRRYANARAMADALRAFVRSEGDNVTSETLSRTMREMFRDVYPSERERVEHYEALAIPRKGMPTPMHDLATEIDQPMPETTNITAPLSILAAGYSAHDDEQTAADGTQPAIDIASPESNPILETTEDPAAGFSARVDLVSDTLMEDAESVSARIEKMHREKLAQSASIDDEPTSSNETSPHIPLERTETKVRAGDKHEATTVRAEALPPRDANPWTPDARTRVFNTPDLALTRPSIGEGPTMVAGDLGFDSAKTAMFPVREKTPTRTAPLFAKEKTPARSSKAPLFSKEKTPARPSFDDKTAALPVPSSGFSQEITKEHRAPAGGFLEGTTDKRRPSAQLSQVLDALSPLATSTKVTPAPTATLDDLARTRDVRRTREEDTGAHALRKELADDRPQKKNGRFSEATGQQRFTEPTSERRIDKSDGRVDPKEVTTRAVYDPRATRDATSPDIIAPESTRKDRQRTKRDVEPINDDATLADERPTEQHDPEPVIEDALRHVAIAKTERAPLFSRGDTVTLLVAAVMGALIMTVSYVYARNVPLANDVGQIERVR